MAKSKGVIVKSEKNMAGQSMQVRCVLSEKHLGALRKSFLVMRRLSILVNFLPTHTLIASSILPDQTLWENWRRSLEIVTLSSLMRIVVIGTPGASSLSVRTC
jgi:hypothetical protein